MAYMLTMAATRRDAAMVLESKKVRGQTQFLSHTKKITKRVARAKKVRGFSGPPNVDGRGGPIWGPISLENVIFVDILLPPLDFCNLVELDDPLA